MKLAAFAAVAVGLVVVLVVARPVLLRAGKNRPRFPYSWQPLTADAYAKLAARPGWAAVNLTVDTGVRLNGLVLRPQSPTTARWIVFYPGNDRSQLANGQRLLEYLRDGKDFGLLVFAYRGFDGSGGKSRVDSFATDGVKILRHLLDQERADPARIHVVAFSLGGFVACAAVDEAAGRGQRVASLSLLASVGTVEMNPPGLWFRVAIGDVYDTFPSLRSLPGRVLVVQGTADEALPVETSTEIAKALGERASLVHLPGARHDLTSNTAALEHVRAEIDASRRP